MAIFHVEMRSVCSAVVTNVVILTTGTESVLMRQAVTRPTERGLTSSVCSVTSRVITPMRCARSASPRHVSSIGVVGVDLTRASIAVATQHSSVSQLVMSFIYSLQHSLLWIMRV